MVPTSFQEQLSNQHPNLHRFGGQLGPILGGFWRPTWGQIGTKSVQKSITKVIIKMITFRIALGTDFDRFWTPKWPPRGGPRGSDELGFRYFFCSWYHLGAKMAPRPPQIPPGTDVDRFFIDFWLIFLPIWLNFGPHLG